MARALLQIFTFWLNLMVLEVAAGLLVVGAFR